MHRIKEKGFLRRTAVMLAGVLFLGLGIALLQMSSMGNDPSSAHVMAMADRLGISFALLRLCANALWAIPEILFGRKYIGIGTFANWLLVGHIAEFFETRVLCFVSVPDIFGVKFALMLLSVLVLSFGIALYQTPNVGVAPYDALAVLLDDYTPMPYFWCRIIIDTICTLLTLVFGGLVGLGTLACSFGLGPFISFFSRTLACRLCRIPPPPPKHKRKQKEHPRLIGWGCFLRSMPKTSSVRMR